LKDTILDGAVQLATHVGFRKVTRKMAAEKAGCALATVSYHFGSIPALHSAIIERGVELGLSIIVAQGLAEGHDAALKAPRALRAKARRHVKLIVAA
jgi:AcrR family transcriptional regulator